MGVEGVVPGSGGALAVQRPRLLITTDISTLTADRGEPDDTQSLVRLLLYACDLEIEGLVASSNMRKGRLVHDDYIEAVVRAYGAVWPNLALHAPRYPTMEDLLSRVAPGSGEYGLEAVGRGRNTAGSDRIIHAVDRPDPRPLWVAVWGGTTDLAQALWRVEDERGPRGLQEFISRMRVHAIGDQDETGPWIKERYPELFYITSYQAFRGMYRDGDRSLVTREWVARHVTDGHGPLGAAYPNYDGGDPWGRVHGVKEGDTPSFLYVLPNGLSDPDRPTWGSWGGRFQGRGAHYVDAADRLGDDESERVTVYRWRRDYQAAFRARVAWCHTASTEANHEPVVAIEGPRQRTVAPGKAVELDASASADPDGDALSFRWWVYAEPGTYRGSLKLEAADEPVARLVAPNVRRPETLHVVLSLTDSGDPPLTGYGRVVLTVDPGT